MNDDEEQLDWTSPEAIAARAKIGAAINDYMRVIRGHESPYVVAWAVGVEWTNTELELSQRAGRDIIARDDQTISATCGLGAFIQGRFV